MILFISAEVLKSRYNGSRESNLECIQSVDVLFDSINRIFIHILQPEVGRFVAFDHIRFWVGNAKQVIFVLSLIEPLDWQVRSVISSVS